MKTIEQIMEELMEIYDNYDPWTYYDDEEKTCILKDLAAGKTESYVDFLEEIVEDGVNDALKKMVKEALEDLKEIKTNTEEKTMKTNTQITEKMIDEVIEVMNEYFTMPDYAVLNTDYLDSENPITKIHGSIMPNDLDELQDIYKLSVKEIINGLESGKYDEDDGCCWYDKDNGTINSCDERTIWNWIDQRSFARFVLSIADTIERYALYEEAEARIKAIAAENPVEPEAPTENPIFTERELALLASGINKLMDNAYQAKALVPDADDALKNIQEHIAELAHLHHKLCDMMQ